MLSLTNTLPQLQQNCAPVGDEFGTPVSVGLLHAPEFREVVDEVSTNLVASHAASAAELETGEAAGRALKALGCLACELGNVCSVRGTLEGRVTLGRENNELLSKATMIANAPTWLKAARFQESRMTPGELRELINDPEKAIQALRAGVLDRLIGKVTNQPAGTFTKQQLPELAILSSIAPDKPLPAQSVTTAEGNNFLIVDATNYGSKKDITDESRKEYGILCAKFVDRLQNGKDGRPQILREDLKMQKAIHAGDPNVAKIYEIRKSNKDRLYFSLIPKPDGEQGPIARIVIYGAHGGDASTQEVFINSSLN